MHEILEIDHLMCGVEAPERAGADFERMGFRVTPLSAIEAMGLGNRCVLFESRTPGAACYLELMGILAPERVPAAMQKTLAGGERVKSMVMVTPDADACYRALDEAGFAPPGPPIQLSREWRWPRETVHPAFAVILPMAAPLLFNVCQHKTLELYLHPQWTAHPNGARWVDSVIAVAREPQRVLGYFEKLFGQRAVVDAAGLARISPAHFGLRVGTPDAVAAAFPGVELPASDPAFVGIGIEVVSLATLRRTLEDASVPFSSCNGAVVVPARFAHGSFIAFTETAA